MFFVWKRSVKRSGSGTMLVTKESPRFHSNQLINMTSKMSSNFLALSETFTIYLPTFKFYRLTFTFYRPTFEFYRLTFTFYHPTFEFYRLLPAKEQKTIHTQNCVWILLLFDVAQSVQKSFLLKVPQHSQIFPNHFVFQHKKTIVHFSIHNSFSSYAWNG